MPPPVPAPPPPADAKAGFERFVGAVRTRRPTLFGSLAQVRPIAFGPGEVVLGCVTAFDEHTLGADDTRRWLEALLGDLLGTPTTLILQRAERGAEPEAKTERSLVEIADAARAKRRGELERRARSHEVIKLLRDELGAEIERVEIADGGEEDR